MFSNYLYIYIQVYKKLKMQMNLHKKRRKPWPNGRNWRSKSHPKSWYVWRLRANNWQSNCYTLSFGNKQAKYNMIKGAKHMNPFRHAWKHPKAHCMSTTIPKLYGSYVGQHWVQKNSLNHDRFPIFIFLWWISLPFRNWG